jgi:putative peptidoglycan lipid II flippase
VLVPAFAHAIRSGNKEELAHVESRGIELASGLALPAAIALAALAEPIVRVLFERGAFMPSDTRATAAALAVFALGLPGHVLVKTFSPVFFAREDTATPMYAALFGFAIAIVGSLALMPRLGHVGIAIAIAVSGWASAVLLGVLIARRIGFGFDAQARYRLPRIVLAAGFMGVTVEAAHRMLAPWLGTGAQGALRAGVLAALIAFGLAVYLLMLRALNVTSPRDLMRSVRGGL